MKRGLLTIALLGGASATGSAFAQTAGQPDWTGPYIGASVGYSFQPQDSDESFAFDRDLDGSFDDLITTPAGANAFSPGFCGGFAQGVTPASGCREEKNNMNYAVRGGYDWQFGNIVVGGLAEAGVQNLRQDVSAFSTTPANYVFSREIDWLAAARGRAGVLVNNTLMYATGGAAYAEVEHSFNTSNSVNTFTPRGDDGKWGYQAGLGIEGFISRNMTVGVEYLYTSLKDDDYVVRSSGPAPAANPFILGNPNGADIRRGDDDFEFSAVNVTMALRY